MPTILMLRDEQHSPFAFPLSPFAVFHYEDGLMLTGPRLAVDFRRRQPRGFVSHAHMDHMARHELALATPATAALYRHRLGPRLRVREMPFGEAIEFGGAKLTALPAGHCLGSAMLLAEQGGERLLYTGDFKLGDSLTAAPADPPRADLLVMESTFGRPHYRMPPRQNVVEELVQLVRQTLADGRTPVIHAYALGKAQEVTKTLTTAGIPVLQHPEIYAISRVYAECGMELATGDATVGEYPAGLDAGRALAGHAVVTLPRSMKRFRLAGLGAKPQGPCVSIAVTGWAIDPGTRRRLAVDHALPLSDHADFDHLVVLVHRVSRAPCTAPTAPRSLSNTSAAKASRGCVARPRPAAAQRRPQTPRLRCASLRSPAPPCRSCR
ncbi:MAG: MBL fold metallo-hydrolase [Planctomycetota bacterium]